MWHCGQEHRCPHGCASLTGTQLVPGASPACYALLSAQGPQCSCRYAGAGQPKGFPGDHGCQRPEPQCPPSIPSPGRGAVLLGLHPCECGFQPGSQQLGFLSSHRASCPCFPPTEGTHSPHSTQGHTTQAAAFSASGEQHLACHRLFLSHSVVHSTIINTATH